MYYSTRYIIQSLQKLGTLTYTLIGDIIFLLSVPFSYFFSRYLTMTPLFPSSSFSSSPSFLFLPASFKKQQHM